MALCFSSVFAVPNRFNSVQVQKNSFSRMQVKKKKQVSVVCSRRIDRLVLYYMVAMVAATFDTKDGEQI